MIEFIARKVLKSKYVLVQPTIIKGIKVYRVKATKDFGNVKMGDVGGYVQSENNLSKEGLCWIYDNAMVLENAKLRGNARLRDKAVIEGNSIVEDISIVRDNSYISGSSRIKGCTLVSGRTHIFNSLVFDDYVTDTNINNGIQMKCE
jgi:NDP-sugar pyrophosphorylase family protein